MWYKDIILLGWTENIFVIPNVTSNADSLFVCSMIATATQHFGRAKLKGSNFKMRNNFFKDILCNLIISKHLLSYAA